MLETPEVEIIGVDPESMEVDDHEEVRQSEVKLSEEVNQEVSDEVAVKLFDVAEGIELIDVDTEVEEEGSALLSLPLSKIKRIFRLDSEYISSSNSAVYATGLATELFIQYLTEQASVYAKLDKRKKLLYKDVSTATSTNESLNFLGDTVPKAQPISDLITQKKIHLNKKDKERFYPEETVQEPNGIGAGAGAGSGDASSPVSKVAALPKGQQTLPLRKAVLHDLMSSD